LTDPVVQVSSTADKSVPVRVQIPAGSAEAGSNKIRFTVKDQKNAQIAVNEKAVFLVPR